MSTRLRIFTAISLCSAGFVILLQSCYSPQELDDANSNDSHEIEYLFLDSITKKSFNSTRTFLNGGSEFEDSHLRCSSSETICSIKFKQQDENWYMADGDEWQLFFSASEEGTSLHEIQLSLRNEHLIVVPSEDNDLYWFKFVPIDVIEATPTHFGFNENQGIVVVKSGVGKYWRSEISTKED